MSKELKATIVNTAIYYGRQLDPAVLEMMAGDLSDLDAQACIDAYSRYRRNPANRQFPLPAQIRELVNPAEFIGPEVQAREIAARIIGAITKHGWCNGRAAEEYIGPVGWEAVLRQGGWRHLCENVGVNIAPTTLQAQMRDQIEGSIRYGASAIEHAIMLPASERKESRGLERAGDVLSLIAPKRGPQGEGF